MEPLRLGQEINCTIVKSRGGNRFDARSNDVPNGWIVELHTREPERFQPGEKGTFWIARITPIKTEVLVHDGEFGRLPITPAMSQRYLYSIEALMGHEELTGDAIGDAVSMVSRIGTQNQADWFTVWRMLGEPKPGEIKHLLMDIKKVRAARKESPESVPELLSELQKTYGERLMISGKRLRKSLAKS